ncbi:MAG: hypothetical protein FWC36_05150 [Spirochaetes bacterium]|nr:hypothetical protein [Spirochaetota bacterium]
MINIFVAFDDKDESLGDYFEDCKNHLLSFLEECSELVNKNPHEISSTCCNSAYLDIMMPKYKPNPFIFIAYSHGNERALCCGDNSYIEKNVNAHHFENSLFYTTACSAGKELGEDLISKGCLAFIGYKSEINVYKQKEKMEITKNCCNSGIIAFLSSDITIYEAYKKMENYYTQQIDKLEEFKDMLFAACLREARDALVFFGNRGLRKKSYFI